jgi:oligoribonuclease
MQKCKQSIITIADAKRMVSDFLNKYHNERKIFLIGSNIYIDKNFLKKHIKLLNNRIHYKLINVSTILKLYH